MMVEEHLPGTDIRPHFDLDDTDHINVPSTSSLPFHGANMRISCCSSQGGRKYMEDCTSVHIEHTIDGEIDYIFLGVFDGHGGADAAKFAQDELMDTIVSQPGFNSSRDEDVLDAIRDGFLETHQAMWKEVDKWPRTASGYTSTAGTTATICFIKNSKIFTGHVGDSAMISGNWDASITDNWRTQWVAERLTHDHKPDSPAEMKRIEVNGGEVMPKAGVHRVVWNRPKRGHQGPIRRSTMIDKIPFLAVARSLGDLWSYNTEMGAFVVSPEPDVAVVELGKDHQGCIVLGSDGLWNVMKPQSAADIVYSGEFTRDASGRLKTDNEKNKQCNHARLLVRCALVRWGHLRADNISAVVAVFDPPDTKYRSRTTDVGNAASTQGLTVLPNGKRTYGIGDVTASVVSETDGCELEMVLQRKPTCLACVSQTQKCVFLLETDPVELVYWGQVDVPDIILDNSTVSNKRTDTHITTAFMHRCPTMPVPVVPSSLLSAPIPPSTLPLAFVTKPVLLSELRELSSPMAVKDSSIDVVSSTSGVTMPAVAPVSVPVVVHVQTKPLVSISVPTTTTTFGVEPPGQPEASELLTTPALLRSPPLPKVTPAPVLKKRSSTTSNLTPELRLLSIRRETRQMTRVSTKLDEKTQTAVVKLNPYKLAAGANAGISTRSHPHTQRSQSPRLLRARRLSIGARMILNSAGCKKPPVSCGGHGGASSRRKRRTPVMLGARKPAAALPSTLFIGAFTDVMSSASLISPSGDPIATAGGGPTALLRSPGSEPVVTAAAASSRGVVTRRRQQLDRVTAACDVSDAKLLDGLNLALLEECNNDGENSQSPSKHLKRRRTSTEDPVGALQACSVAMVVSGGSDWIHQRKVK